MHSPRLQPLYLTASLAGQADPQTIPAGHSTTPAAAVLTTLWEVKPWDPQTSISSHLGDWQPHCPFVLLLSSPFLFWVSAASPWSGNLLKLPASPPCILSAPGNNTPPPSGPESAPWLICWRPAQGWVTPELCYPPRRPTTT